LIHRGGFTHPLLLCLLVRAMVALTPNRVRIERTNLGALVHLLHLRHTPVLTEDEAERLATLPGPRPRQPGEKVVVRRRDGHADLRLSTLATLGVWSTGSK
jgi:hypothetical protein